MNIVASIDFEQYKAVLAALRAPGTPRMKNTRRRYSVLGISTLITISFLLAYTAHDDLRNGALIFVGLMAAYLLCSALQWWSKYRYNRCLKSVFEAQEKQLSGQPMSITEEGISGQSADLNYSYRYRWASFVRLIDLPDALLFLPNAVSFVRIPKAPLSSEDIYQIIAWWSPYAPREE